MAGQNKTDREFMEAIDALDEIELPSETMVLMSEDTYAKLQKLKGGDKK